MLEVLFLVWAVVNCPFSDAAAAPPPSPHLPVKVYDLGHGYDEKTLSWVTSQSFEFTKKEEKTLNDGTWYASNEFKTAEHSGTHLDAPYHFSRIGWKVGDIPLNNFIAQGVLMDLTSEVRSNADFEVMPNHLQQWEKKNGPLPQRSVLLIKTGWSARYPNKGMYFGTTTNETSKMHFPDMLVSSLTVLALLGCQHSSDALLPALPELPEKIHDLSHAYNEKTLSWINEKQFQFSRKDHKTLPDGTWHAENDFQTSVHSGTHLDAPYYTSKEGWKVGDIPLLHLIGEGVLLDVSREVGNNADFELRPEHLEQWEYENGALPERSILMVKFGWSSRYPNKGLYFGTDSNDTSKLHFPGISEALAKKLAERNVLAGVGVDTPSLDAGKTGKKSAELAILGASLYAIKNLKLDHLPNLPARGFTLYVMPMNIMEGTGAPCRVFAVMDQCVWASGKFPGGRNKKKKHKKSWKKKVVKEAVKHSILG